jgi:hypothetical protein
MNHPVGQRCCPPIVPPLLVRRGVRGTAPAKCSDSPDSALPFSRDSYRYQAQTPALKTSAHGRAGTASESVPILPRARVHATASGRFWPRAANPMLIAVLLEEPAMANRQPTACPARRSGAGEVPQNPLHKDAICKTLVVFLKTRGERLSGPRNH